MVLCVDTCVCMHTHNVYIDTYTYICTYIHIYMYVRTYCMYVCMYVYISEKRRQDVTIFILSEYKSYVFPYEQLKIKIK